METVGLIATYVSFAVAGLIVALNAIAPLTKTDVDNKILNALRWFQDTILKILLPQHVVEVKKVETVAPAKEPE